MLDKGKITSAQLACMMFLTLLATGILTSSHGAYIQSKSDMWMTPIIGSVSGFAIVFIVVYLHRLYPGKTLIQYSEDILGKFTGKIVSLIFLLFSLQLNANLLRQFSEFLALSFLRQTPLIVLISTLMILCVCAVRSGVEIIGRSALLLTPLIVLIVLILIFPLLGEVEIDRMLPAFENGFLPVLRGVVFVQAWFPTYVYMTFFLPFVSDVHKAQRWGFISVLWTIAIYTGTLLLVLTILGDATKLYPYPFMQLTRYVIIFDFFQHLDALIMLLWVLDVFVRSITTFYAVVLGFAQWFRLPNYKPLVLPIGVLIVAWSFWSVPNTMTVNVTLQRYVVFYYFFAHMMIPILLLVVALLRGRKPVLLKQQK
ncbi:MAG: endospore germination permease [Candidatus Pristimantibacillus sp.]